MMNVEYYLEEMRQWHAFLRGENHDYDKYIYCMESCQPKHVVDAETRLEESAYTVVSTGKGEKCRMIPPTHGSSANNHIIMTQASDQAFVHAWGANRPD